MELAQLWHNARGLHSMGLDEVFLLVLLLHLQNISWYLDAVYIIEGYIRCMCLKMSVYGLLGHLLIVACKRQLCKGKKERRHALSTNFGLWETIQGWHYYAACTYIKKQCRYYSSLFEFRERRYFTSFLRRRRTSCAMSSGSCPRTRARSSSETRSPSATSATSVLATLSLSPLVS